VIDNSAGMAFIMWPVVSGLVMIELWEMEYGTVIFTDTPTVCGEAYPSLTYQADY